MLIYQYFRKGVKKLTQDGSIINRRYCDIIEINPQVQGNKLFSCPHRHKTSNTKLRINGLK